MATLNREDFLKAPSIPLRKVAVPLLGGDVYVKSLTVRERDELERQLAKRRGRDARPRIAVAVACTEDGDPLFAEDDIAYLRDVPAAYLEPIIDAHVELNGMSVDDIAELEKN